MYEMKVVFFISIFKITAEILPTEILHRIFFIFVNAGVFKTTTVKLEEKLKITN